MAWEHADQSCMILFLSGAWTLRISLPLTLKRRDVTPDTPQRLPIGLLTAICVDFELVQVESLGHDLFAIR